MVAISLYRGNMHRAPDVPRRWLMPTPKISLKEFRSLLQRRNKALSRLRSASSSYPNPNSNPQIAQIPRVDGSIDEVKVEAEILESSKPSEVPAELPAKGEGFEPKGSTADVPEIKPETDGGGGMATAEGDDGDANLQQLVEQPDDEAKISTIDKVHEINQKEIRKREVEEKLQVLNSKKHNLVLVLKQILNVEEELKRRNSGQGTAVRPAVSLQVEVPNDSGSMSREVTPRVGSEANLAGENEGGVADDASNHNVHSRHVFRMSSVSPSPSSESPLRKPPFAQHNVVPLPGRASMAVSGSPSRFAPAVNQGHPANNPTVSVSGTNYIASSPSPAASGGTSVFRDTRQPSPWN